MGNGKPFCISTVYFMDPTKVCTEGMPPDSHDDSSPDVILYIQKGESYKNTETTLPAYHDAANSDRFQMERFFLGMGHHFTFKEADPESCTLIRPFQGLYAHMHGKCILTGYVSSHVTKTPDRDGWEKPGSIPVKLILAHPSQCELDHAGKGEIATMHVF